MGSSPISSILPCAVHFFGFCRARGHKPTHRSYADMGGMGLAEGWRAQIEVYTVTAEPGGESGLSPAVFPLPQDQP